MAANARTVFQTIPLEYAYGVYSMLRDTYGKNWAGSLIGRDADMAKVCALISGMSTVPAPYASYMLSKAGGTLLKTYDDASIAIIASVIAGNSQMFVQGDYQHLLLGYYNALPEKIRQLFPDITAVQAERREPGYQVMIKTPSEDRDYADIFMPAANIRIRLPKRVYEDWITVGILQVAKAPSLVDGAAFSPDFLNVMGTFIEKSMLEGTVNLPTPYMTLPLILRSGQLGPDNLPPVGEWIAADISSDVTVDRQYTATQTATTTSTATTINAALNFAREGATTTGNGSYTITESTGTETEQVGSIEVQNLRVTKMPLLGRVDYNVNTFDFNINQVGSRLQTIGTSLSAVAPKGAETAILFQRNEAAPATAGAQGDVTLTAHLYQRAANGSFILSDAVTLSQDDAQSMYEQAFGRPLQRLYAGGRVQPSGNVMAQLDGAMLFSGPWTSDYTKLEQLQGTGGALQVSKWGGYIDYEQTRSGRAAGAFGHFMPDKQAFWVGRLTVENVRQEGNGQRKFYAEGSYTKVDETEMRGFLTFAKNMTSDDIQGAAVANHMFGRDHFGMRYGGTALGRLITEDQSGRETTGGGRIYGVSKDMINGVVASAVYKTYAQKTEAQTPLTLSSSAQAFYNNNIALTNALRQLNASQDVKQRLYLLLTSTNPTEIQTYTSHGITVDQSGNVTLGANSAQWLQTYVSQQGSATSQQTLHAQTTQMLVSAGVRQAIGSQLNLESGAGWDVLNNQGAAMLNFDWTPLSDLVSDVGLRAYFITRDAAVIPIIGGMAGFTPLPMTKFITEAYYPGLGELRLRMPFLEIALGGGEIKDIASGAHLGIRIPLGMRWTLGAATSLSSDYLKAEAKRLTQQEGIIGVIFTMPYSDKAGFRLANVFGSFAFINQNQELAAVAAGKAFEWDATAGLNWVTSRSTITGKFGSQYWEATTPQEFHSMYSLTGGMTYSTRTLKFKGMPMLINPALSGNVAVGTEDIETATSNTSRLNLRVNFTASTLF
jgi:hypothetical protein